jgi:hypothetical protein
MSTIFKINDKEMKLKRCTHIKCNDFIDSNLYSSILYGMLNKKFIVSYLKTNYKEYIDDLWFLNLGFTKNMLNKKHLQNILIEEEKYKLNFNIKTFIEIDNISKSINRNRRCIAINPAIVSVFNIYLSNIIQHNLSFIILDLLQMIKESRGEELTNNIESFENEFREIYKRYFKDHIITIDNFDKQIMIDDKEHFLSLSNYPINYIYIMFLLFLVKKSVNDNIKYIVISNPEIYLDNKEIYLVLDLLKKISQNKKIIIFTNNNISNKKIKKMFNNNYIYYEL